MSILCPNIGDKHINFLRYICTIDILFLLKVSRKLIAVNVLYVEARIRIDAKNNP